MFCFLTFSVGIVFLSPQSSILCCLVGAPYNPATLFCFIVCGGQSFAPTHCCSLCCPSPLVLNVLLLLLRGQALAPLLCTFPSNKTEMLKNWNVDHETVSKRTGKPHSPALQSLGHYPCLQFEIFSAFHNTQSPVIFSALLGTL